MTLGLLDAKVDGDNGRKVIIERLSGDKLNLLSSSVHVFSLLNPRTRDDQCEIHHRRR